MPNNIVDAVQQLEAASKQAGGIAFNDKGEDTISDNYDREE